MALERSLDPAPDTLAPSVSEARRASIERAIDPGSGFAAPRKLRLAFCLFKFFPYGGLGRDFIRIARESAARGHQIHVFTMDWPGEMPTEFAIHKVPISGITNRAHCASYVKNLRTLLAERRYDAVIGFNRMPGLDIYYAADVCHAADVRAQRHSWLRFTPRHRLYSAYESAVFHARGKTQILLISEEEKKHFQHFYGTEEERFHSLPPGVTRDRVRPPNALEIRAKMRDDLGISEREHVLLLVGSNWRKKGLDRALRAVASLPTDLRAHSHFLVFGKDREGPWARMARQLRIERQVRFMGLRNDVPRMLLCADVLLHPAYRENTGTVLLEAIVAGLPVLASDVCGYAFHIGESRAGLLVPSPFSQVEMNQRLRFMLTSGRLGEWRDRALEYMRRTDLFSLKERAVDLIEEIVARPVRPCGVGSRVE